MHRIKLFSRSRSRRRADKAVEEKEKNAKARRGAHNDAKAKDVGASNSSAERTAATNNPAAATPLAPAAQAGNGISRNQQTKSKSSPSKSRAGTSKGTSHSIFKSRNSVKSPDSKNASSVSSEGPQPGQSANDKQVQGQKTSNITSNKGFISRGVSQGSSGSGTTTASTESLTVSSNKSASSTGSLSPPSSPKSGQQQQHQDQEKPPQKGEQSSPTPSSSSPPDQKSQQQPPQQQGQEHPAPVSPAAPAKSHTTHHHRRNPSSSSIPSQHSNRSSNMNNSNHDIDDEKTISHLQNECVKLQLKMSKLRKYTQEWFQLEAKLKNAKEELEAAKEDRDLHFSFVGGSPGSQEVEFLGDVCSGEVIPESVMLPKNDESNRKSSSEVAEGEAESSSPEKPPAARQNLEAESPNQVEEKRISFAMLRQNLEAAASTPSLKPVTINDRRLGHASHGQVNTSFARLRQNLEANASKRQVEIHPTSEAPNFAKLRQNLEATTSLRGGALLRKSPELFTNNTSNDTSAAVPDGQQHPQDGNSDRSQSQAQMSFAKLRQKLEATAATRQVAAVSNNESIESKTAAVGSNSMGEDALHHAPRKGHTAAFDKLRKNLEAHASNPIFPHSQSEILAARNKLTPPKPKPAKEPPSPDRPAAAQAASPPPPVVPEARAGQTAWSPTEELRDNHVVAKYKKNLEINCQKEKLRLKHSNMESSLTNIPKFTPEWFQLKEELVELTIALDDDGSNGVGDGVEEEAQELDDKPREIQVVRKSPTNCDSSNGGSVGSKRGRGRSNKSAPLPPQGMHNEPENQQHSQLNHRRRDATPISHPPVSPILRDSLSPYHRLSPNEGNEGSISSGCLSPYNTHSNLSAAHSVSSRTSGSHASAMGKYCYAPRLDDDDEEAELSNSIGLLKVQHEQSLKDLENLPQYSKEWFDLKTKAVGLSERIEQLKGNYSRSNSNCTSSSHATSDSSTTNSQDLKNQSMTSGWTSVWSESEAEDEILSYADDLECVMVAEALKSRNPHPVERQSSQSMYDDESSEGEPDLLSQDNDELLLFRAVKALDGNQELETLTETQRQNDSATKIQSIVRGRLTRYEYHRKLQRNKDRQRRILALQSQNAIIIQAWIRKMQCIAKYRNIRRTLCVVKIQCIIRSHFAKQRIDLLRADKIQQEAIAKRQEATIKKETFEFDSMLDEFALLLGEGEAKSGEEVANHHTIWDEDKETYFATLIQSSWRRHKACRPLVGLRRGAVKYYQKYKIPGEDDEERQQKKQKSLDHKLVCGQAVSKHLSKRFQSQAPWQKQQQQPRQDQEQQQQQKKLPQQAASTFEKFLAIAMQALQRGYHIRKVYGNFHVFKKSAIFIQSWIRGRKQHCEYARWKASSIAIQIFIRGRQEHQRYLHLRQSTIITQAFLRMAHASIKFKHTMSLIVSLQRWWRQTALRILEAARERAAVCIQALSRSKHQHSQYLQLQDKCIVIQSHIRRYWIRCNRLYTDKRTVVFHSSGMGVRLSRGKDGFVRVLSVTAAEDEATAVSSEDGTGESSPSIVRDGKILPGDMVMEASGIKMLEPITREEWGQIVRRIRCDPRPMKFEVVGIDAELARRRDPRNVFKRSIYASVLSAERSQWKHGIYASVLAAELSHEEVQRSQWSKGIYSSVLKSEQARSQSKRDQWKASIYTVVLDAEHVRRRDPRNVFKRSVYASVLSAERSQWKRGVYALVLAAELSHEEVQRSQWSKGIYSSVLKSEQARSQSKRDQWKVSIYSSILGAEHTRHRDPRNVFKRSVYASVLSAERSQWKRGIFSSVLAAEQSHDKIQRSQWSKGIYSSMPKLEQAPLPSVIDKLEQKITTLSMELMLIGDESSPDFQETADRLNALQEELRERRNIELSSRIEAENEQMEKEENSPHEPELVNQLGPEEAPVLQTERLKQQISLSTVSTNIVAGSDGSIKEATATPNNVREARSSQSNTGSDVQEKDGQQPEGVAESFESEMLNQARMRMKRIRQTLKTSDTSPPSTEEAAPPLPGPKALAEEKAPPNALHQINSNGITKNEKNLKIECENENIVGESSVLIETPSGESRSSPSSEKQSSRSSKSSSQKKKSRRTSGTKKNKEKKLTAEEKMKNLSTDFVSLSHRMKSMPKYSPEWTLSKMEMKLITDELEFLYAESLKKGAAPAVLPVGSL